MENIILKKSEEVLPILSLYTDTNFKVNKFTSRMYRNFIKRVNGELSVKPSLTIIPAKDEEFEIIAKVILYIIQNPEKKAAQELMCLPGFYDMIESISKLKK